MEIVKYPDPRLRQKAEPITAIDAELRRIARDMIEAMHEDRGVGLAGPQVAVFKRIVIINVSGREGDDHVFLNPRILDGQGHEVADEGCLSVPGIWAPVERYAEVTVQAMDPTGRRLTLEAEGLLARAFQHEIDHLDGVLFIDRLTDEARQNVADDIKALEAAFSATA